ncbi:hypothetical protein LCGC14_0195860 [marine sediment metagenome]|uniref:Uncharacterized protein n=1 Tax=marine sediment metagenome TaxID=412755 RepID=A0A0F9XNG7_9ZZZZ
MVDFSPDQIKTISLNGEEHQAELVSVGTFFSENTIKKCLQDGPVLILEDTIAYYVYKIKLK